MANELRIYSIVQVRSFHKIKKIWTTVATNRNAVKLFMDFKALINKNMPLKQTLNTFSGGKHLAIGEVVSRRLALDKKALRVL